jgi:integrase
MVNPELLAALSFREAAPIWFEAHKQHVGPGSARNYVQCIRALSVFFAELPLAKIHIGHFEQYQRMRSTGTAQMRSAGPSCVNHELNTLSQILHRAGLWAPLLPHYKPMKLPKPKVGCALVVEDEERLFRMAATQKRWQLAYCCALITANTTAGPAEIANLRLGDIDLVKMTMRIEEGVKNKYRRRTIPLNEPAAWAVSVLLKRAQKIGATAPEHYLLPHRARNGENGFDVTRHIYSWRTAWNKLRVAARLPHLRMYDLRHHAITRLLEDEQISERTVIELAGQVSRAMLDTYSHIRLRTKREAVDLLAKKGTNLAGKAQLFLVKK